MSVKQKGKNGYQTLKIMQKEYKSFFVIRQVLNFFLKNFILNLQK